MEVSYDKGGQTLAGENMRRGIYLNVSVIGIGTSPGGHPFRSFGVMAGLKLMLEPLKRANPKKLKEWLGRVEREITGKTGQAWAMVQKVLLKNSIELKE